MWGINNLDRNVQFVHELYADISPEDIKTFAEVQQKLLQKLEDIKSSIKKSDS